MYPEEWASQRHPATRLDIGNHPAFGNYRHHLDSDCETLGISSQAAAHVLKPSPSVRVQIECQWPHTNMGSGERLQILDKNSSLQTQTSNDFIRNGPFKIPKDNPRINSTTVETHSTITLPSTAIAFVKTNDKSVQHSQWPYPSRNVFFNSFSLLFINSSTMDKFVLCL